MAKISIGNRIVVEAYKKEGLKTTVSNGFAMVQQKVALVPLEVKVEALLVLGNSVQAIPAGSKAFFREEFLHTHPSVAKVLDHDELGRVLVLDASLVEFFEVAD